MATNGRNLPAGGQYKRPSTRRRNSGFPPTSLYRPSHPLVALRTVCERKPCSDKRSHDARRVSELVRAYAPERRPFDPLLPLNRPIETHSMRDQQGELYGHVAPRVPTIFLFFSLFFSSSSFLSFPPKISLSIGI